MAKITKHVTKPITLIQLLPPGKNLSRAGSPGISSDINSAKQFFATRSLNLFRTITRCKSARLESAHTRCKQAGGLAWKQARNSPCQQLSLPGVCISTLDRGPPIGATRPGADPSCSQLGENEHQQPAAFPRGKVESEIKNHSAQFLNLALFFLLPFWLSAHRRAEMRIVCTALNSNAQCLRKKASSGDKWICSRERFGRELY